VFHAQLGNVFGPDETGHVYLTAQLASSLPEAEDIYISAFPMHLNSTRKSKHGNKILQSAMNDFLMNWKYPPQKKK